MTEYSVKTDDGNRINFTTDKDIFAFATFGNMVCMSVPQKTGKTLFINTAHIVSITAKEI